MNHQSVSPDTAPDEQALIRALGSLEREPLWHASLGSKELFHSNLIAWMAQRFPEQAAHVFEPWLTPRLGERALPPLREKRHLDVVLRLKNHAPLVIENKMFSMPRDEQLADYSLVAIPSMRLADPRLVLLSLIEPDWSDDGLAVGKDLWEWMSYGKLAVRLGESFPADATPFDETVVHHYSRMLMDLQTVADSVKIMDVSEHLPAPYLVSTDLRSRLGRLVEIASKLRANQLRRRITDELDRRGLHGAYVKTGFTNGTPIIDWATSWDPGRNAAGWQYQAGQWRLPLHLRTDDLLGPVNKSARERFALRRIDWFDFGPFHEIVGGEEEIPTREASGGFNHYNPDFIYRYRKLTNPSAEQIVQLAVAYSVAAERLEL